ncbi:MAG TPA: hypothetical protein VGP73_01885 [Thermoanaerobaculia bacterium]
MEIYLELEERVALADCLSQEIVLWFSRARARRQVDRSELRLLRFPHLEGSAQRILDFNQAVEAYRGAVRDYFLPPSEQGRFSEERIRRMWPSAAIRTIERLALIGYWQRLSKDAQRSLVAEQYYERTTSSPDDRFGRGQIIENIMKATIGDIPVAEEETFLTTMSGLSEEAHLHDERKNVRLEEVLARFEWDKVITEHTWSQRRELESALAKVQRTYMRVRVLAIQS